MCTTTTAISEKLSRKDREAIVSALRSRELRLTPRREAVCETIFSCPGHICAEHILGAVSEMHPRLRMNKTTVYRTLDLLLELGLLTEHKCADGRAQYEPASRGRHSHAICRKCGALVGIDGNLVASIQTSLRSRHGFEVDLESYPIFGLCSSCGA